MIHYKRLKFNFYALSLTGLIVVGVVFGYLNYMRFTKRGEAPAVAKPTPQNSSSQSFVLENGQILQIPSPTDPAGVQEFINQARSFSKEVSVIDISGCSPKPKIAKITTPTFTLQNKDSVAHTIMFNQGQYNVPAKGNVKIKSEIIPAGVHGFGCDDTAQTNSAVGFIDKSSE